MKRNHSSRKSGVLMLMAALALASAAAWGHHSIAGKFDDKAPLELSGIVTHVDWRDPHVHIFMNVSSGREILNWAVELESPILLEADGWTRQTLSPGDSILVKGIRARDGSRQLWGQDVRRTGSGAQLFTLRPRVSMTPLAPRPTPRWPDGRPALGALPGTADGYWTNPSKTALVEDGVDVRMDAYGLLANLEDAPKVAPMQPWALALYRHRQSRQLRDDPMFKNCKPPGGVRQYQSVFGFQLLEDRERQRIFVLIGSGNHNYRIIYMDGRPQVGQVGGDDDNPLYYGRSVAAWEGDTLVADTRGFNEDFWFTNGGLPHTEQLRLVERFTRVNFDTLNYEVTIDDPGAYTRPWKASWTLRWVAGEELPVHICQENRP